jgi:hypothetical protein
VYGTSVNEGVGKISALVSRQEAPFGIGYRASGRPAHILPARGWTAGPLDRSSPSRSYALIEGGGVWPRPSYLSDSALTCEQALHRQLATLEPHLVDHCCCRSHFRRELMADGNASWMSRDTFWTPPSLLDLWRLAQALLHLQVSFAHFSHNRSHSSHSFELPLPHIACISFEYTRIVLQRFFQRLYHPLCLLLAIPCRRHMPNIGQHVLRPPLCHISALCLCAMEPSRIALNKHGSPRTMTKAVDK